MNLRGWWQRNSPFVTAAVTGDSMVPAYRSGDWVLIHRTRRVRPGQVVAAPDPRHPDRLIIKRIARPAPGGWYVLGDNPAASTDSRCFGPIATRTVTGRVLLRYRRAR